MAKESMISRAKNAWNVFMNKDPTLGTFDSPIVDTGPAYYSRPDRHHLGRAIDKTIVNAIYNRLSLDVSSIDIRHVYLDSKDGRFMRYADSDLDNCLSIEANKDQTSRNFIQDAVLTMLDKGVCAIVPVDTIGDPDDTESYRIQTMRVGTITQWYPNYVEVDLYNDRLGKHQQVKLPKRVVAVIENPFYSVMNEPSSTLQRLVRKLSLLDSVDEQASSGKLDLIIQLPYTIKTPARQKQADARKKSIEDQLKGPYGIAYVDGTEKITQLNRPVENNLLKQIEYLTSLLFSQLGLTEEILNGTANESTMTNYYSRTIEPLVSALSEEMKRKFLTKTAITQGQSIEFFRDPFKLVPVGQIADIADKFTRNCIMTSNELRQVIGMKPVDDPTADQLINSNLNHSPEETQQMENPEEYEEEIQNE